MRIHTDDCAARWKMPAATSGCIANPPWDGMPSVAVAARIAGFSGAPPSTAATAAPNDVRRSSADSLPSCTPANSRATNWRARADSGGRPNCDTSGLVAGVGAAVELQAVDRRAPAGRQDRRLRVAHRRLLQEQLAVGRFQGLLERGLRLLLGRAQATALRARRGRVLVDGREVRLAGRVRLRARFAWILSAMVRLPPWSRHRRRLACKMRIGLSAAASEPSGCAPVGGRVGFNV